MDGVPEHLTKMRVIHVWLRFRYLAEHHDATEVLMP